MASKIFRAAGGWKIAFHSFLYDPVVIASIISVVLTAILLHVLPYIGKLSRRLASVIVRRSGGWLARRDFEKIYLDWVVTENREVKLAGIVGHPNTLRPELEKVFSTLNLLPPEASRGTQKHLWEILSERSVDVDQKVQQDLLRVLARWEQKEMGRTLTYSWDEGIRLGGRARRRGIIRVLRTSHDDFPVHLEVQTSRKVPLLRLRVSFSGYAEAMEPAIAATAALVNHKKLALLGSPGSGKTTLLQYIALAFARERVGDSSLRIRHATRDRLDIDRWRTPIFISLASLSGKLRKTGDNYAIAALIPDLLPPELKSHPACAAYFKRRIEKGDCIFLLDGLDEVARDVEFRRVVKAVEAFSVRYDRNRFVVTSRIAGWRTGLNGSFVPYHLQDLADDQINKFAEAWYQTVEIQQVRSEKSDAERRAARRRAAERADNLKSAIRGNEGIRRLVVNPMLLSIVALVHRSMTVLPRERAKLYGECSKILLEHWDTQRGLSLDSTRVRLDQKEYVMRELAFAIHVGRIDSQSLREIPLHAAEAFVAELLPAIGRPKEESPQLLQSLIQRSGLLLERRRGFVAFAHHTFQEYFAAQKLLAMPPADARAFLLSEDRRHSDWWREVILLYTGALPDAAPFISGVLCAPEEDDLCQRRLQLASACSLEAATITDSGLRETILHEVLKVRTGSTAIEVAKIGRGSTYLLNWSTSTTWYLPAALNRMLLCESEDEKTALISGALRVSLPEIRVAALRASRKEWPKSLPEAIQSAILDLLQDPLLEDRTIEAVTPLLLALPGRKVQGRLYGAMMSEETRWKEGAISALTITGVPHHLRSETLSYAQHLLQAADLPRKRRGARILCSLLVAESDEAFLEALQHLAALSDDAVRTEAKNQLRIWWKTAPVSAQLLRMRHIEAIEDAAQADVIAESVFAVSLSDDILHSYLRVVTRLTQCLPENMLLQDSFGPPIFRKLIEGEHADIIVWLRESLTPTAPLSLQAAGLAVIARLRRLPFDAQLVDAVLKAALSKNVQIRTQAITALAKIDVSDMQVKLDALRSAAADDDPAVRLAAVRALSRTASPEVLNEESPIFTALLSDSDAGVSIAASAALCRCSDHSLSEEGARAAMGRLPHPLSLRLRWKRHFHRKSLRAYTLRLIKREKHVHTVFPNDSDAFQVQRFRILASAVNPVTPWKHFCNSLTRECRSLPDPLSIALFDACARSCVSAQEAKTIFDNLLRAMQARESLLQATVIFGCLHWYRNSPMIERLNSAGGVVTTVGTLIVYLSDAIGDETNLLDVFPRPTATLGEKLRPDDAIRAIRVSLPETQWSQLLCLDVLVRSDPNLWGAEVKNHLSTLCSDGDVVLRSAFISFLNEVKAERIEWGRQMYDVLLQDQEASIRERAWSALYPATFNPDIETRMEGGRI